MVYTVSQQTKTETLQRGRAQTSAEIKPGFSGLELQACASTGPRSNERGDLFVDPVRVARGPASTGPRSNERGDLEVGPRTIRLEELLQRGRAQTSAEIDYGASRDVVLVSGFNGAALKRARR